MKKSLNERRHRVNQHRGRGHTTMNRSTIEKNKESKDNGAVLGSVSLTLDQINYKALLIIGFYFLRTIFNITSL